LATVEKGGGLPIMACLGEEERSAQIETLQSHGRDFNIAFIASSFASTKAAMRN